MCRGYLLGMRQLGSRASRRNKSWEGDDETMNAIRDLRTNRCRYCVQFEKAKAGFYTIHIIYVNQYYRDVSVAQL